MVLLDVVRHSHFITFKVSAHGTIGNDTNIGVLVQGIPVLCLDWRSYVQRSQIRRVHIARLEWSLAVETFPLLPFDLDKGEQIILGLGFRRLVVESNVTVLQLLERLGRASMLYLVCTARLHQPARPIDSSSRRCRALGYFRYRVSMQHGLNAPDPPVCKPHFDPARMIARRQHISHDPADLPPGPLIGFEDNRDLSARRDLGSGGDGRKISSRLSWCTGASIASSGSRISPWHCATGLSLEWRSARHVVERTHLEDYEVAKIVPMLLCCSLTITSVVPSVSRKRGCGKKRGTRWVSAAVQI